MWLILGEYVNFLHLICLLQCPSYYSSSCHPMIAALSLLEPPTHSLLFSSLLPLFLSFVSLPQYYNDVQLALKHTTYVGPLGTALDDHSKDIQYSKCCFPANTSPSPCRSHCRWCSHIPLTPTSLDRQFPTDMDEAFWYCLWNPSYPWVNMSSLMVAVIKLEWHNLPKGLPQCGMSDCMRNRGSKEGTWRRHLLRFIVR